MPDVKFYLKRNTPKQETAITARVYLNGSVFKYGIGKSIYPELWNTDTQMPINGKNKDKETNKVEKEILKSYKKLNPNLSLDLENIKTRIENIDRDILKEIESYEKRKEVIDLKQLREYLDSLYKTTVKQPQKKSKAVTLNKFIEDHIKEIENGATYQVGKKIKKYSRSTINVYKEWKTQYLAFQKSKRKVYNFDDIDMDFYKTYVAYFISENYATNSIGKQIKILKALLNVAYDKGLHQNLKFRDKKFVTLKEDVDSIYLTNAELSLFYNLDLSDRPELEMVRDVFLVGCWTALRYSDYKRIKPDHIVTKGKKKYIKFTTQKTTELVMIPLRPELESILEKYDYKLPKTYEQKVNEHIKDIGKELGLSEPTTIGKTKGGLTVEKTVPKYKLIQTHTARRTGATLMYDAKIPLLDIMKITGHRKPESLLKYIKTSKEETAERLSTNEFFSGPNLKKVV